MIVYGKDWEDAWKTKILKKYPNAEMIDVECVDLRKTLSHKQIDENLSSHHYVVDVTSSFGNIGEEYDADSLEDLASQIRAKLAWMNGAEDDTNTSWIPFEYISVEDENGNDVTEEANAAK